MGELSTQIMTGDIPVVPISDIPEIKAITEGLCGWELYRSIDQIAERFWAAMSRPYHLKVWARLADIAKSETMTEQQARELASIIVGEWGVGPTLGAAVAQGIRDYCASCSPGSMFAEERAKLLAVCDCYANG